MKKILLLLLFTFTTIVISAQIYNPVSWEFSQKQISDSEVELQFKAEIEEHWHMYSQFVEDDMIATKFTFFYDGDTIVLTPKEGKPIEEYEPLWEMTLKYFEHEAIFKQKVTINSLENIQIGGYVDFMVCDESQCLPPDYSEFSFTIEGVEEVVEGKDVLSFTQKKTANEENKGLLTLFFIAFLSGFAALLTPCVFPMIPMTVSFFTKQSQTKAKGITNAIIYGISIIVIYVLLGTIVTAAFGSSFLNELATGFWANIFFFLLIMIFAISFLGAFEISLPTSWINKSDKAANRVGLIGIFFMAFTLALVSFSCTGPIVGPLLVQSATVGGLAPIIGMLGFSLALALPFSLFAAFPGWLNSLPKSGGLAIIGTERHDSRRVDRQLRGRSGRQGDPGSSQFFVSLEDKLMRLFGSERIAKLMDKMGLEEGEVISHSMVNKSIERAQKKVEENNFGTRKRLLEYDDVMNKQRDIIYTKRKHALFGERLSLDVTNMIYDTCFNIVNQNHEFKDFDTYKKDVMRILTVSSPVNKEEFTSKNENEILDITYNRCVENYKNKSSNIAFTVLPQIKDVFKNQSATYKNIVIPFTDGIKTLQVTADLEQSVTSEGANIATEIEKGVTLAIIDDFWKEHLREMDDLKQSVQNAVYEQKDPLLIYKFEAIDLFKVLMSKINKDIVSFLLKAGISGGDQRIKEEKTEIQEVNLQTSRESDLPDATPQDPNKTSQKQKAQPIRTEQKIGRNDPCPCGSGKKYKKCHGK